MGRVRSFGKRRNVASRAALATWVERKKMYVFPLGKL